MKNHHPAHGRDDEFAELGARGVEAGHGPERGGFRATLAEIEVQGGDTDIVGDAKLEGHFGDGIGIHPHRVRIDHIPKSGRFGKLGKRAVSRFTGPDNDDFAETVLGFWVENDKMPAVRLGGTVAAGDDGDIASLLGRKELQRGKRRPRQDRRTGKSEQAKTSREMTHGLSMGRLAGRSRFSKRNLPPLTKASTSYPPLRTVGTMIIQPKIRGFICTTAHPAGCAANVQEQIDYVRAKGPIAGVPKKVLVIGASTGYGLASRIVPAFAGGAATLGIFFEKPGEEGRTGSAGWYNSVAFEKAAHEAGLYAKSLNGDAFSDALKEQAIATIKADLGQVDAVIYSLASPRRTNPKTGVTHSSTLKPIGASYTNKSVNTDKGLVTEVSIEPASEQEIADTVAVMGGEDWEMWIDALDQAGVLAEGATTVAYSYIGPDLTWAIYRNGTIGRAKEDLEATAARLTARLGAKGGRALVSVNKALVTQASSAIPVVPLYISLLYKVMKAHGNHEGCIEQIQRLFADRLATGADPKLDEAGRVRIDDWEMQPEIQKEVADLWPAVNSENLAELSDIAGYRTEFLRLFGFGLPGVDYAAEAEPVAPLPSAK